MESREEDLLNYLIENGRLIHRGAESNLYLVDYLGFKCVLKYRIKKRYRIEGIDEKIRRRRTLLETSVLQELWTAGVPVPSVIYVNVEKKFFLMEFIKGIRFRDGVIKNLYDEEEIREISGYLGKIVASIHNRNISHGDLTTANMIVSEDHGKKRLYIIDFGLSGRGIDSEEKAVDIEMFYRVLEASHTKEKDVIFNSFTKEYKKHVNNFNEIILRFRRIRRMGRYIESRREKNG